MSKDVSKTWSPLSSGEPDEGLGAYLDFIRGVPVENSIAKRFISAAHLLARAMVANMVFNTLRSLDLKWEEAAQMTGEIMGLSRSSVVRAVRDIENMVTFWNANGFEFLETEDLVQRLSTISKERLAAQLQKQADKERREGEATAPDEAADA